MENNFKFLKGNIETIILNALYSGDKYGYEIAKEIKEKTDNKYEIKQPTLYSYLKRLEEQNLLEFYWGDESHGGRRKYFRLTHAGKETCERYMSEWNFHKNILDSLVAEPDSDLPEYTPQDNLFLGSKGDTKRKRTKKDFRDEEENNQLFEELIKLTQPDDEKKQTKAEELGKTQDVIKTVPIIERSETSSSDAPIEKTTELLRITDCDEKFTERAVPHASDTIFAKDEVFAQKQEKADYLDRIISNTETENKQIETSQFDEEKEPEVKYKAILGDLLGEQIVNTDEKIAQIAPQLANYRDEFVSENLTITEMADTLSKEGYRIRFYNTASSQYRAVPMLIKNKINCITAWTTLCVFYVLLALSWIICGNTADFGIFGLTALGFLIIPLYFTYIYVSKPNIRIKPSHNFKHSVINKLIIFIFVSALIISLDFLVFKIDFASPTDVVYKFLIPEFVILMLVVFELVYKFFLKYKTFYN